MNWFPIFIATLLASSTTITAAGESTDALFQWPSFTNNHHHASATDFIKRVQCAASIHNVYSCLRSTFVKIPTTHHHDLLHHAATDCCTTMADFRNRCGGFRIGVLESSIFPPVLFKQCSAGDAPMSSPAPDAAGGPAADIEV